MSQAKHLPVRAEEAPRPAWVSIQEAALLLRVSTDTIRRRIKRGGLIFRLDRRGHYLVEVPGGLVESARSHDSVRAAELLLEGCRQLVDELRRQHDHLLSEIASLERHIEAHERAEEELRNLLSSLRDRS